MDAKGGFTVQSVNRTAPKIFGVLVPLLLLSLASAQATSPTDTASATDTAQVSFLVGNRVVALYDTNSVTETLTLRSGDSGKALSPLINLEYAFGTSSSYMTATVTGIYYGDGQEKDPTDTNYDDPTKAGFGNSDNGMRLQLCSSSGGSCQTLAEPDGGWTSVNVVQGDTTAGTFILGDNTAARNDEVTEGVKFAAEKIGNGPATARDADTRLDITFTVQDNN